MKTRKIVVLVLSVLFWLWTSWYGGFLLGISYDRDLTSWYDFPYTMTCLVILATILILWADWYEK